MHPWDHWSLPDIIAVLCSAAGFLMMWLGYTLSKAQIDVKQEIKDGIAKSTAAVSRATEAMAKAVEPHEQRDGITANPQAGSVPIDATADYVKALAELAKSLGGLTPAIAAFIIATILFFLAAALAIVDHSVVIK